MTSDKIILGVDPAIRNFGLSIHRTNLDGEGVHVEPLWGQVIETRPPKKKDRSSTQSSRDFLDFQFVARNLLTICRERNVGMIAAESASWPRAHRAKVLLAAAWGILATVCEDLSIPLVEAQPKAIKLELTGKATASKAQVMEALDALFPDLPGIVNYEGVNIERQPDHFYDSCGAVWTCRNYPEVLAWLR